MADLAPELILFAPVIGVDIGVRGLAVWTFDHFENVLFIQHVGVDSFAGCVKDRLQKSFNAHLNTPIRGGEKYNLI